jgi:hypothetical protein
MNIQTSTSGVVLSLDVVYGGSGYISATTSNIGTHAVSRFLVKSNNIVSFNPFEVSLGLYKIDSLRVDCIFVGGVVTSASPNELFRGLNYKVGELVSVCGSNDAAILSVKFVT